MSRKKLGTTLMIVGVGAQLVDVLTSKTTEGGVLFGTTGVLRPIDQRIPKVTLPVVNVPTNMAFWIIVAGLVLFLWRR